MTRRKATLLDKGRLESDQNKPRIVQHRIESSAEFVDIIQSWQVDVRATEEPASLKDPRVPGHVLAE